MPLTTEESIKKARVGIEKFEKNWKEINEPDGYVATMAREKDFTAQLNGEVFSQGLTVLRDLAKNHFTREKPGFFARLFRTKAAREYKAERDEMNRLAKYFGDIEKDNNTKMFVYTEKGLATHTAVSVDYMIRDPEGFEFSSKELDDSMIRTRHESWKKLNRHELAAQDTKQQIIDGFLNNLDKEMEPVGDKVEEIYRANMQKQAAENDPKLAEKLDKDINKEAPAENEAAVENENEKVNEKVNDKNTKDL